MDNDKIRPCDLCHGKLSAGLPLAGWRVTIQRLTVNRSALRERVGLEILLGSPKLADVMGTGTPILEEPKELRSEILVCEKCGVDDHAAAAFLDTVGRVASEREAATPTPS